MYLKEAVVHDELMRLIDLLESEPDPAARLLYITKAMQESRTLLIKARGAAAYDARNRYSTNALEKELGINRGLIGTWVARYVTANRLPPPPDFRRRHMLSRAIDLTGLPSTRRAGTSHSTS